MLIFIFVYRAWVTLDNYYLMTEADANKRSKNGKGKLDAAVKELQEHLKKFEEKHGMKYPFATEGKIVPDLLFVQLPGQDPEVDDDEEVPSQSTKEQEEDDDDEPGQLTVDVPADIPSTPSSSRVSSSKAVAKNEVDSKLKDSSKTPALSPVVRSNNVSKTGLNVEETVTGNGNKTPRSKIAQDLKKTLQENNKRKSLEQSPIPSRQSSISQTSHDDRIDVDAMPAEQLRDEVKMLRATMASMTQKHAQTLKSEREKFQKMLKDMETKHEKATKERVTKIRDELVEKHNQVLLDAKRKQWCSHCFKEAIYYCCWNTSYCSSECQNLHWGVHMTSCQQERVSQEQYQANDPAVGHNNSGHP